MSALLEAIDVTVTFGGLRAVDGVSLQVNAGSIVGLIGPNGAGKTTLFNTITGLQPVDTGRILLHGRDVTGLGAHERAGLGVGRSFQNLGLMTDETVETNVLAACHLAAGYHGRDLVMRPQRWWQSEKALHGRVAESLAAFGIEHERHRLVRDLSFATARFVELASVVSVQPRLMLLDEPTTGLDVAEIAVLAATLRRLRDEGTTMLVIAHDVGFVMELCDHVVALASGRVLASGSPAEVRHDPRVVEAWVGAAPA